MDYCEDEAKSLSAPSLNLPGPDIDSLLDFNELLKKKMSLYDDIYANIGSHSKSHILYEILDLCCTTCKDLHKQTTQMHSNVDEHYDQLVPKVTSNQASSHRGSGAADVYQCSA